MDSEYTLSQKLETVLNGFLLPGFCNASSADFELLATYLGKKEHEPLLETPVVAWIDRCVNILLTNFRAVHHTVVSLMFKLSAICAENEWLMIGLREKQILEKITIIVKDNVEKFTASNKLGHIRLLTAVSKHNVGLRWIKESKSWFYIVKYCCENHTLYVVREASLLIYDILYKFSAKNYDTEFCLEIIDEILKPIDQGVYQNSSTVVYVDDSKIQKSLCPTLDLISLIFQKTLDSKEKTPIAHLCDVHHKIVMNIWKLAKVTHNEYFLGKILKAQTMYNFAMLVYQKWDSEKIDPCDFNEFGVNFFNTMKFCVSRRSCVNFLKLAKMNHFLWKKLGSRAPSEIFIENDSIQFENQLIMFHLMPVLCIVKTQPEEESIFDQYIKKLFSISSEFTVRICYSFRDILLDCSDFAAHLAYKSIHGVLSMKTILNKDQAVVLFQALVYVLKEFTIGSNESSIALPTDPAQRLPQVLYATLACLYTLVEGFDITWKESIESMCLMDIVLDILKKENLSSLTVVQSIKLAQLSIEHFLSPNMALLVDNLKGSGLQNLGPIVIKNFHNIEWEVRDSTIELVTSIVSISRLKFPAFQQYILENNICPLVFDIVHNDQESYVRATALKCLTQMIAVNLLWEKSLTNLNLVTYLLEMICNESEGIVRKEAITCVTQMYIHNRIQATNKKSLYCTLAHIGVNDLYWEVKVAAINFWETVIHTLFTNQGMIDGTFPTVTFSKEKKKIVTLTETEIILRIKKILIELSEIGCLNVILKCLNDDCDLEVVKVAVVVVKALFQKLDKYNYEKALTDDLSRPEVEKHSNLDTVSNNKHLRTESNGNTTKNINTNNNVIDDIVSTKDSQLLSSCYKETGECTKNNVKKQNTFVVVTPKEFVMQLKGVDFDKIIENRKNWFYSSESLSTFLDDLLLSSNIRDSIHADCY
ncbi:uncharacterized protein LOC129916886 [Episyrphus balteatus]|uniref:uncharacterized protein LOC129916886 n=1 Tax=Episyrphus balteatus TaxID=286459 RepID=UPI002486567D|nr:uncharacterized protein LOC129916886 [Episyrphus balteatus]